MSGDVDRERLERLRGDLAELRARAVRDQVEPAAEDAERGTVLTPVPTSPAEVPTTPADPRPESGPGPEDPHDEDAADGPVPSGHASRPPERSAKSGRRRVPRPPRRNPFRRRAHRPPDRLAVPVPIPVTRRSVWSAPPRWPTLDWVSGTVIALVLIPAAGQLVFRLWTAMMTTSVLAGADPSRADSLAAAAGVAGGGLTTALAIAALAVVRGRLGYLAGAAAVLLMFAVFPYMAYTANAGIVAAPLPSLAEMVAPRAWPRGEQLGLVFLLTAAALTAAVIDLLYRGALAVRAGLAEARR